MTNDPFVRRLLRAFEDELPGPDAQNRLAPRPRKGWQPGVIPDDCRPGAGLLLIYPSNGEPVVLLTKRHDELPQHAGQVSLPGGALEAGETIEQAALREAREETGIDAARVRVVGRLTPLHIPVSRFVLHPVVGWCDERPDLLPQPGEVDRLLEASIRRLGDSREYEVERRTFRGTPYRVPFLTVEGEKLWGATAMVLAELMTLLGSPPDPWSLNDVRGT
jgi:8-oxo-dGTP pyrophosphatase MutT (NUDIX family)